MMPNFKTGDQVLAMRHKPYAFLRLGDIILLESWPKSWGNQNKLMIKRVVGLPGDVLYIYNIPFSSLGGILDNNTYNYYSSFASAETKVTYVVHNNEKKKKEYLSPTEDFDIFLVPSKHIFVMGDWLLGGIGSATHGPVPLDKVAGFVIKSIP